MESNDPRVVRSFFVAIFLFVFHPLLSQPTNYIVFFSDKNNSPFSIQNPSAYLSQKSIDRRTNHHIVIATQDLPVNPVYLDSLAKKGAYVLIVSKWLNAALVSATPAQIASIQSLPFVVTSKVALRNGKTNQQSGSQNFYGSMVTLNYGNSFNQNSMIGLDEMHQRGYQGQGVSIAVLDAGFQYVNSLSLFDSLFIHNRIIATYDLIDRETDVYDDHNHGTQVLSMMAAFSDGNLIGGAWRANYLLLRTEDAGAEYLGEELYWVRGAEYADSAGVDIIHSSVGYTTFDNPATSHTYADLDGNTTLITRGADIAASKGILVVNSMGNEGNSSWKYMLAPADGDSVLSVGGVNPLGNYHPASSAGPTYDGRIKPDVVAQGTGVIVAAPGGGTELGAGTSFAAPLITSLAAGLWQAFPELTNLELIYYIRRSSSLYFNPDVKMGYGIPNFSKSFMLIAAHKEQLWIYPNPQHNETLTLNFPKSLTGNKVTITFTDITGKQIAEETIADSELVTQLKTSLNDWSPGIYLVIINVSQVQYILKIFKK